MVKRLRQMCFTDYGTIRTGRLWWLWIRLEQLLYDLEQLMWFVRYGAKCERLLDWLEKGD